MAVHCVTPNPALDVTYRLPEVTLHAVNRIAEVIDRPGGKGVNVARLLAARGLAVTTHGFLAGACGGVVEQLLRDTAPGIDQRWTATIGETRRTIAVVDDADTTMFNEPGPTVTEANWAQLNKTLVDGCLPGDVVTVSGSLPRGTDPGEIGRLVASAKEAGARVIVDTVGPALLSAAQAGADVLKPNREELLRTTGDADLASSIASVLRQGAVCVTVSLGAEGIALADASGIRHARLNRALTGNPTGAGDAVVAALAHGLARNPDNNLGKALQDVLPAAIAWSAATVLSPVAGEFDAETASQLIPHVIIKESRCSLP